MVRAHASTQRLYKLCPRCGQSWAASSSASDRAVPKWAAVARSSPGSGHVPLDQSNLDPQLFDMIHADARSWYGFYLISVDDYLTIPIATLPLTVRVLSITKAA
jgi:hypothetical protein